MVSSVHHQRHSCRLEGIDRVSNDTKEKSVRLDGTANAMFSCSRWKGGRDGAWVRGWVSWETRFVLFVFRNVALRNGDEFALPWVTAVMTILFLSLYSKREDYPNYLAQIFFYFS